MREAAVIDDLSKMSGVLVATGGGSVLLPENRRKLVSRGVVVFLDTSLELQIKRTEKDKKRPLLQSADHGEVLRELKEKRHPLYAEVADLSVFVGEESSRRIVNNIVRMLKEEHLLKN